MLESDSDDIVLSEVGGNWRKTLSDLVGFIRLGMIDDHATLSERAEVCGFHS